MLLASAFSNVLNLHNVSEHVASGDGREAREASTTSPAAPPRPPTAPSRASSPRGRLSMRSTPRCASRRWISCSPRTPRRRSAGPCSRTSAPFARTCSTSSARASPGTNARSCSTGWRARSRRRGERTRSDADPQASGRDARGAVLLQRDHVRGSTEVLQAHRLRAHQPGPRSIPHGALHHPLQSWMGGDRDGNPFVTATCTRDVVYLARITAVNLYFKAIQDLIFSLSMWRCTDAFQERAQEDAREPQRRRRLRDAQASATTRISGDPSPWRNPTASCSRKFAISSTTPARPSKR